MKPNKQPNPSFTACIEIYKQWFEANFPYPPTFGARNGKSMNEILFKLSATYHVVKGELPTTDELNNTFKLVLDKREMWGFWKDKCFHLHQINDKLIEILEEIKKNNGATKENRAVTAYDSIKGL